MLFPKKKKGNEKKKKISMTLTYLRKIYSLNESKFGLWLKGRFVAL